MRCRSTVVVLVALSALACAGESPVAPSAPPDEPTSGGSNVVTITPAGVSPQTIQIRPGERVLFVNTNTVVHEISSDDHPSHLECPAINQVGSISPGQSKETGNFVTAQTCMYHDHLDALNPGVLGTIVIME